MHDPTKVLLGTTQSSARDVSRFDADPATFVAGLAVRIRNNAIQLSVTKTDGLWAGISLGRDLSDTKKTAVLRCGEKVPLLLDAESADGTITITSYANLVTAGNDTIEVAGVEFTAGAGAATPGAATFQAATSNNATATSLAAQINAHAAASALVTAVANAAAVVVTAKAGGADGNELTLVYTDNGTATVGATVTGSGTLTGGADEFDHAVPGAVVYISDTTGKATQSGSGSTASNAIYVSGALDGIKEDGTTAKVALVDMPGGL